MDPSTTSFFAVALVSLIAVVSPGPDFFIVFRNSLVYSRNAGYATAVGITIALIVHLSYTLVGIGVVIAESPFLYTAIRYSGVGYLFYIGVNGIVASFKPSTSSSLHLSKAAVQISLSKAFMQGFWTNLLNPKAAVFFISLFSQFINADTSMTTAIEYAFINWAIALGWFLLLSYLLTHQIVSQRIEQFRVYIDRVMGGVLIALGAKLLFV